MSQSDTGEALPFRARTFATLRLEGVNTQNTCQEWLASSYLEFRSMLPNGESVDSTCSAIKRTANYTFVFCGEVASDLVFGFARIV
jgi:hypothetical protein